MADFERARSREQKEQRMAEVKAAALKQFSTMPYHQITLTTIAHDLSWSRTNLYQYASTKEEIFLALAADLRDSYFRALLTAFPFDCQLSFPTIAEVWAGIMNAHTDWFRIHDLLFAIIETNVSTEKLVEFKRGYYAQREKLATRFENVALIPRDRFEPFMNALNYHACGVISSACNTPRVIEAITTLGQTYKPPDFRLAMREFIGMCLDHWAEKP